MSRPAICLLALMYSAQVDFHPPPYSAADGKLHDTWAANRTRIHSHRGGMAFRTNVLN